MEQADREMLFEVETFLADFAAGYISDTFDNRAYAHRLRWELAEFLDPGVTEED